jgi:hypothetical protein
MGCWDIIGPFAVVKGCAHNPTQFVVLNIRVSELN